MMDSSTYPLNLLQKPIPDFALRVGLVCKLCWPKPWLEMVGTLTDMGRTALCDEAHAKGNEMCTQNDFDSLNLNETPSDATNIPV